MLILIKKLRAYVPDRLALPLALLLKPDCGLCRTHGYGKSIKSVHPLDEAGQPLPWINYTVIDLLSQKLPSDANMIEFGSGSSTLFFMKRLKSVVSIEHDKEWFEVSRSKVDDNVRIMHISLENPQDYYMAASRFDEKFDFIFVDGRQRVKCVENSLDSLSPSGVLLLDDTERDKYKHAFDIMLARGFRYLSFKGIRAGSIGVHQSTLFYRDGNILGI